MKTIQIQRYELEQISETNELFQSLRNMIRQDISGLDHDFSGWRRAIGEVDTDYRGEPRLIERYRLPLDEKRSKMPDKIKTLYDRIFFYRANPWKFAEEILSRKVLNITTPAGTSFLQFTPKQKEYLRDLVDPNVPLMIMCCNRGGSKTWLNALGIAVIEYCIPKIKATIIGGSKEQSLNLYNFFSIFVRESQLKYIVKGDILQTHTNFVHGGWVKALAASERSVRGPRPDFLFLDEVCEMESNLLVAALPQVLTASKMKVAMSSTPHKLYHRFRDIWIEYQKYGYKRYHWNAYECPWISEQNINMMKDMYDSNEFRIEVLGEFGSSTGVVFSSESVEYAIWSKPIPSDLALSDHSHGIDWGYKHPTTSIISGIHIGPCPCGKGDDHVWIVDSSGWSRPDEDQLYSLLYDRSKKYDTQTFTDSSHIFQNNKLRSILNEIGLTLHPLTFKKYKDRLISNARNILEKRRIHILKTECHELINQLLQYSYMDSSEQPRKENDDYVDGFILSMWPYRIARGANLYAEPLDASHIVDKMTFLDRGEIVEDVDVGGRGIFRKPWGSYRG